VGKSTFNLFKNLTIKVDLDNNIIKANSAFLKFINKNIEDVLGKKESDFFKQLNLSNNSKQILDETIEINKEIYYFKIKRVLVKKINKEPYIKIIRRNITEFKKYSVLYDDHKNLLKYIATAKPIEFILDEIIKSVEKRNNNMICSILLLDESKQKLIKGAAPSLPEFYNEKLNGMQIGANVGSCGAAVFLKERVIVKDIQTHENWKYAKNLAAKVNLQACWSQPFFSSSNEVLGSFAIYYNTPKEPSEFDIKLIEDIANITGIAVENHNNYLQKKRFEEEKIEKEQILMHKTKQAMMGEMLENIAHQWRQPLSIISTYATGILMKKKYGIDTSNIENEAFESINLNAQYLSNTIDDFRNYFATVKEKNSFSIDTVLNLALKLIDSRVENENIKIKKEIVPIIITNYENELIQVLINILNNSIDVLSELKNTEDRYIGIQAYKENDLLVLKILDSGNGAPEDILERIFEPYFTTKKQKLGTGIGLYMCQEIVGRHLKGTITAKNAYFYFQKDSYLGLEFEIRIPDLKQ